MNIFTEIRNKITPSMRKKLDVPADHSRPQDDVPDERVVHRVVADYQRMYNERQALIDYIRAMEKLYKETQSGLYKAVSMPKLPTRNRLIADVRLALYDMTNYHIIAQKMLRKGLGIPDVETENNRRISDEAICNYGRAEEE